MRLTSRIPVLAASLVASVAIARPAAAQCPLGSYSCYFGTDIGGTGDSKPPSTAVSDAAAAAFLARLVGAGTENFEGIPAGSTSPIGLTFPGAGMATLTGGGSVIYESGVNGVGRYPTSGTHFYEATSATGGGSTFAVDFSDPVAAFGFYAADIGDFGSQLSLRFSLIGGGSVDWMLPYIAGPSREGSLLYAGFIAETGGITGVQFLGTNSADVFAFDDMTIGSLQQVVPPTITPEPASLVLMATGIAGMFGIARRRYTKA